MRCQRRIIVAVAVLLHQNNDENNADEDQQKRSPIVIVMIFLVKMALKTAFQTDISAGVAGVVNKWTLSLIALLSAVFIFPYHQNPLFRATTSC